MGGNRVRKLIVASLSMLVAVGIVGPATTTYAEVALNGRIAYYSYTGDMTLSYDVFSTNLDGSGQTNLSNAPETDDNPAWSPDGTKIAFRAQRAGNDEIYVMNADGSGQTNLTKTAGDEEDPAWSPDATKIAFAAENATTYEVFVMNADGTGRENLTEDPGFDGAPTWSPDGTKIAFETDREGDSEIYVMNADGSGQANLTEAPSTEDRAPAWSPDGTRIAFVRSLPGNNEIFIMNADGSGQENVSDDAGTDEHPAWAPDGTRIAFLSDRDGNSDIHVMNADGSGATNVTNDAAANGDPSWQPIPPTPSVSKAKANEGEAARFKVKLPEAVSFPVTYELDTEKGKAKPGKDFKKRQGSVTFAPGQTVRKVKVKTKDDGRDEPKETFFLEVSHSTGRSDRGKAKITDDD